MHLWMAFSLTVSQGLDFCKLAVEPVPPEEAIVLWHAGVHHTASSPHHTSCAVHPNSTWIKTGKQNCQDYPASWRIYA